MLHRDAGRLRLTPPTIVVALAVLATLGIPSVTAAFAPDSRLHGSGPNSNTWLVQFNSDVADNDALNLVGKSGATQVGEISELGAHVLDVPAGRELQVVASLAHDPRVVSIERDTTMQATVIPRDPHWRQAWGPRRVRAPGAWNMTTGRSTTIIAIVDTGVDPRQPDLRGRVLRGWDFQNNDANPRDDNGHGTAVAGVAAAAANDGVGIAGMCWHCDILPVKVLNANGSGSHSNIAAGIVWATKHGADVINLSLAGPYPSAVIANAIKFARNHGVVVVAAAGNEGSRRRFYPAAYPGVISVAATNGADRLYKWSNHGSWVKLAAPGCAFTGKPGSRWSWWCGTSFATPVVAGTAALIKSLRPKLSRVAIERMLLNSTVPVRGVAEGRIDALRAVHKASSVPTPTPTPVPTASPSPGSPQPSPD